MPFTHKDGTLVFVDRNDVEQHYTELEPIIHAQAVENGKVISVSMYEQWDNMKLDRGKWRQTFNNSYIDQYYLTAIAAAESAEELRALNDTYALLLKKESDRIRDKQEERTKAWHGALVRMTYFGSQTY